MTLKTERIYYLLFGVGVIALSLYGMRDLLPEALNKYSWQARDAIVWRAMMFVGVGIIAINVWKAFKED